METWTRRTYPPVTEGPRKLVIKKCFGYTPEEAKSRGLSYYEKYEDIPLEGSGWFLTDDGWIVHCHKREKVYEHKHVDYLLHRFNTDLGQWFYSWREGKVKVRPSIKFELFKANRYRPLYTKNDYINKLPKARLHLFVNAYVSMVMHGERVDYEMLGRIMDRGHWNYKKYALQLLNMWKVKQMLKKELLKQLEASGVTLESTINKFEEAYNIAKGKKDAQTMTRVAENYLELFARKDDAPEDPNKVPADYEELGHAVLAAQGKMEGDPNKVERVAIGAMKAELEQYDDDQAGIEESIQELLHKPTLHKP